MSHRQATRTEEQVDEEIAESFPASDPPSHTPVVSAGPPQSAPAIRRQSAPAFGYALSSEENAPKALIRQAKMAEEIGLDFVSISDHLHPWIPAQGNSPFVWAVLGGIAASTDRIVVGTGVTCPILRTHPVIIGHAAATIADMFEGRFYLGLGTGEALNELVTGERWPSASERLERLEEAAEIISELMTGEEVNHDGAYYTVSQARLFTHPVTVPPILVAAESPGAATLAAKWDGMIATSPKDHILEAFQRGGGTAKPIVGQVTVCWDEDEAEARKTAHKYWPNTVLGPSTRATVPTPEIFEDIVSSVTEDQVAEAIPCGPDPGPMLEQVEQYVKAGFDHIYIHQIGTRQEEFLRFYSETLLPSLRKVQAAA